MKPKLPTISWREIYDKYPEAWKVFWEWITSYDEICAYDIEMLENRIQVLGGCEFSEFTHFNRGDLYSFFDELGIYVNIEHTFYEGNLWSFIIHVDNKTHPYFDRINYNSRKESEQKAFLMAFELLNNRK